MVWEGPGPGWFRVFGSVGVGIDGVAGADEVFVAVDIIDAADWGPVFVVTGVGVRVGGGGAGVGEVP